MVALAEKPTPGAVESDARSVWTGQRLPPSQGPLGPADGPVVRQFLGAFAAQESGTLAAQRVVAADVDARALMVAGRRVQGVLRLEDGGPPVDALRLEPVLAALGAWVGGAAGRGWDADGRRAAVQTLVGRLAHMGALAVRDVSLRICPACAEARSPERIVYQEEDGETLLVRFAFPDGDRTVSALVWTDAAWRLLGTSALMIHPDVPYVIARYRRKGAEELVFTSKSSLTRIRGWLPGAELEVVEEHPGRHWQGRVYEHPLRHEFPMGGEMEPPCGTIVPVADVSDTGTGVVPLIPGHGGTDTQIADRLRLPGWPLVTPKGRFDILFVHKYAGLELDSGNEFVARDLEEGGAIFARLRVRRGVPHCARCGTPLIWAPGRAWCLEPSRLPAEKVALYRSLLPRDRPIERLEVVPWPVSEPQRSDDPLAVSLLECSSCDRLDATEYAAARCACGGRRRAIRRRLLGPFDAAAAAWASVDPFAPSDAARLYVNERRRAPALVHYIAAMSGIAGNIGDVRLSVLPTVPEEDLLQLVARHGADAVRSAFVRAQGSEGATATFEDRCAQEARRLESFWRVARRILLPIDSAALVTYAQPIAGALGELLPEDRALLARFERMRVQATVDYDRSRPDVVHRRLFAFLENDLPQYLEWVAPRLAEAGAPPSRRVAMHTLVHVLFGVTQLLGPIAPFTAESVHRALRRSRASLFQEPPAGVERALLDPARGKAWDRWLSVVRTVDRFRRSLGVAPDTAVPSIALVVDSDPVADEYRAEAPTIERIARIAKLEVGSPGAPWAGRRHQLKPRESEIQRVYPSRAAQIIHLLRRLPERKATDATSGAGFSVTVNGQPTQILPSMVEWGETLPDRFVPVEWPGGELYASLPTGVPVPAAPLPPLSRDGLEVVARVRRRLRGVPSSAAPVVVLAVPPALAADLTPAVLPIARYLGATEVRLVASDGELPAHGRAFGRTRAGVRWSFHVSQAPPQERSGKHRPTRPRGARIRPAYAPADLLPTVRNYAEPDWVAREGAVRALGEELDQLLGAPLLGPAKAAIGWEAGLRDVEAYRSASWEKLTSLPGFGRPVATVLVSKLGGVVPPPPSSHERRASLGVLPPGPRSPPAPVVPSRIVGADVPSTSAALTPPSDVAPSAGPPPRTLPGVTPRPSTVPPSGPPLPAPAAPVASTTPVEREEPPVALLPPVPALPALPPHPPSPTEGPLPPDVVGPSDLTELPPADSPATADEGAEASEVTEPPAPSDTALVPVELGLPAVEAPPSPPEVPAEPPDVPGATLAPTASLAPEPNSIPELEPPVAPGGGTVPESQDETEGEAAPPVPSTAPSGSDAGPEPPSEGDGAVSVDSPPPGGAPAEPVELEISLPPAEADFHPTPSESPVPETVEAPAEPGPAEATEPPMVVPPSLEEPVARPPESSTATSQPLSTALEVHPAPAPETAPSATVAPEGPTAPTAPSATTGPAVAPSGPLPPDAAVVAPPTATPEAPPPAAGVDLAVGPSYLPSLERFLEATAAGHQGICIVRDSPERIRAYVGSRPVEIRWLTTLGRGPTLKPADLDGFSAFLAHAVSSGHVTAFFLEGVEYLVRLHGLDRVIERMVAFDRLAREHAARVWVTVNPRLLSGPELERFVAAFGGAPSAG